VHACAHAQVCVCEHADARDGLGSLLAEGESMRTHQGPTHLSLQGHTADKVHMTMEGTCAHSPRRDMQGIQAHTGRSRRAYTRIHTNRQKTTLSHTSACAHTDPHAAQGDAPSPLPLRSPAVPMIACLWAHARAVSAAPSSAGG